MGDPFGVPFDATRIVGAKRRVVESVCAKSGIVPARPDPTRPAISATRVPALKMVDLGPPTLAILGRDTGLQDSIGF